MKKSVTLLAAMGLFSSYAYADMIEVKNKGILNGTVISQDSNQMIFKDATGVTHTFPKIDILYSDVTAGGNGAGKSTVAQKISAFGRKAWEKMTDLFAAYKRTTARVTNKAVGGLSKPLDRSRVNERSSALSKVMDNASKAAAAASKKNRQINAELKRNEEESFGSSQSSKHRKKRFVSLSN